MFKTQNFLKILTTFEFPAKIETLCASNRTITGIRKLFKNVKIALQRARNLSKLKIWPFKIAKNQIYDDFEKVKNSNVGKITSQNIVWKFQNFAISQILREINFRSAKIVVFCNFRGCEFY